MKRKPKLISSETDQNTKRDCSRTYLLALALIFTITFVYIFNKKIDLNGDNCEYYILSTSISTGHGYSNIASADMSPSNTFPPGYPLLMSIVRIFTPSIMAQKILNGLFLLSSVILLLLFIRQYKLPESLAFISCTAIILNTRILHFSTMMMSEMSYILFSVLALWALYKIDYSKPFWKDKWFYLLIFAVAYNYHIRTQGITLAIAVVLFFLISRKWKHTFGFMTGYAICLLPWIIRNKMSGVVQSRYLNQIFGVNNHRPEEGVLDVWGVIGRCFDTGRMLITKAIPNTVMPYFKVDYEASTTLGEWIIAIIILAIIVIGIRQFGRFQYFFFFYFIANIGIISLFNDPGENRYITTITPFLEAGLFIGLYVIISAAFRKIKVEISFSPLCLTLLFLCFSFPNLKKLHHGNKAPFPPPYNNFFSIARETRKNVSANTIICSRKPGLFYIYGRTYVCSYKWTTDAIELVKGLIDSNVDYVVLEQLGYSSTYRYLYPAIEKYPDLFVPTLYLPNPDTYLLRFEKEKASSLINQGG